MTEKTPQEVLREAAEKTPQEVLREAAEYIGEHGWTQGMYNRRGSVCALGAIFKVTYAHNVAFITEAMDLLANEVGVESREHIPDWNDDPNRTAEDVILAMKRAASND